MLQSAVTAAIRDRFEAEWDHDDVPAYWPNAAEPRPGGPYVKVSWRFGANRIATSGGGSGNNIHRQSGEVIIRVFEIQGAGEEDRVRELADDAAEIFRSWRSNDLRFYEAGPAGEGERFEGGRSNNLYMLTVLANFDFDLVG